MKLILRRWQLVKQQRGENVGRFSWNLFDDDAIINLYQLLRENPPNLEKRFKKADRKGKGKITVEEFT